ncbi:MAG: hypothetical protein G01um101419_616 [Parcubacteria group bacterium Gr01-1014_19]|nr:MAG: hypothetical protein G01um101419_616 [Parcubacteria group bacterium Gr01-1014_19]
MRTVIIGLGGIGTYLAEPALRITSSSKSPRAVRRVLLVDGDQYEEKNRERQIFRQTANKAQETAERLKDFFPNLEIDFKPSYVTAENAFLFIKEGDTVFLGVDNHATRKVVSDRVATLDDALLISGGNDLRDGNVQVYRREGGKNITPALTFAHPEIEFPKDKNPADLHCGEMVEAGVTQVLAANLAAASLMVSVYTIWLQEGKTPHHEIYFDILTGKSRSATLPEDFSTSTKGE